MSTFHLQYHQHHHSGHLHNSYSDKNYHQLPQESTITTTGLRNLSNSPRKAVILKRVTPNEEDEADIFGKLTAKKLRNLSAEQRDSMMIQINQLFYDKCHKKYQRVSPKRKMVDKCISTLPAVQYQARIIRRATTPTTLEEALETPSYILPVKFFGQNGEQMDVQACAMMQPVSSEPKPVEQEATTPKPPNEKSGLKCGLM